MSEGSRALASGTGAFVGGHLVERIAGPGRTPRR